MTVVDDLSVLTDALHADVLQCMEALVAADTQTMRRHLVRATFAEIEGILYAYKLFALKGHELNQVSYSPAELALLREEDYDLDAKGIPQTRPARLTFAANLLFTIRSLAKAFSRSYDPPTGEVGWMKLKDSAKVRDRLMHPKAAGALLVSDGELIDLGKGREWWVAVRTAVVMGAGSPMANH
jgi:hypothetical protein